jgi:hypothetical protein
MEHPPQGAVARWRSYVTERKKRRLLGGRNRRRLVASLRRAATYDSTESRRTVLLVDRVAAVRNPLLEIASVLERADDLDPSWVSAIHRVLTDGCESPLYNRDVHVSELLATLYYLRGGLEVQPVALD